MDNEKNGWRRWLTLIAVQVANLIAAVDATITNIALPSIAQDYGISAAGSAWLITAYFIVNIVFMPISGRLADRYGRRPFFIGGFALFCAASLAAWQAPSFAALIAVRTVQAIGAACLIANGSAISAAIFTGRMRGIALGLNSTVIGLGYSLGFVVGGLIVDLLDWRMIFLVNLPFGLTALGLSLRYLPRMDGARGAGFSPLNMALLALAIAGTIYGLRAAGGREPGLDAALSLIAGLTALVLFIRRERRVTNPVLPQALLGESNFQFANLTVLVFSSLLATIGFLLPFYLRTVLHLDGGQAGLTLVPYSVVVSIAAPLAGWLAARGDGFALTALGLGLGSAVAVAYALLLGGASGPANIWVILLGQTVLGLAAGLFYAPNRLMLFSSLPPTLFGAANSVLQIVNAAAFAIGPTIAAIALEIVGARHGRASDFTTAQSATFTLIAAAAGGGVVWALRRRAAASAAASIPVPPPVGSPARNIP